MYKTYHFNQLTVYEMKFTLEIQNFKNFHGQNKLNYIRTFILFVIVVQN